MVVRRDGTTVFDPEDVWVREPPLLRIERVLADTEPLRNLCDGIFLVNERELRLGPNYG